MKEDVFKEVGSAGYLGLIYSRLYRTFSRKFMQENMGLRVPRKIFRHRSCLILSMNLQEISILERELLEHGYIALDENERDKRRRDVLFKKVVE